MANNETDKQAKIVEDHYLNNVGFDFGDKIKYEKQIKKEKISAIFVENISKRRLLDQIVRETGARIGGTLYSDALSKATGPAGTYLDLMRHNIRTLVKALGS